MATVGVEGFKLKCADASVLCGRTTLLRYRSQSAISVSRGELFTRSASHCGSSLRPVSHVRSLRPLDTAYSITRRTQRRQVIDPSRAPIRRQQKCFRRRAAYTYIGLPNNATWIRHSGVFSPRGKAPVRVWESRSVPKKLLMNA